MAKICWIMLVCFYLQQVSSREEICNYLNVYTLDHIYKQCKYGCCETDCCTNGEQTHDDIFGDISHDTKSDLKPNKGSDKDWDDDWNNPDEDGNTSVDNDKSQNSHQKGYNIPLDKEAVTYQGGPDELNGEEFDDESDDNIGRDLLGLWIFCGLIFVIIVLCIVGKMCGVCKPKQRAIVFTRILVVAGVCRRPDQQNSPEDFENPLANPGEDGSPPPSYDQVVPPTFTPLLVGLSGHRNAEEV